MDTFTVLTPGLYTTVQDLGRSGYARFGVPESGALDTFALQAANVLVGNEAGAAGIEVTQPGLALRVHAPTVLAVAGADLRLQINGVDAASWCVQYVGPGDIVRFVERRFGVRAYVAVAGGIDVPVVLGSRSTYVRGRLGGVDGRPLRQGDGLATGNSALRSTSGAPNPVGWHERRQRVGLRLPERLRRFAVPRPVRVIAGPQADAFAPVALQRLLAGPYLVAPETDRMGCRLQGPNLPYRKANPREHISDGIAPGSIQVAGDGQPIVLLADRQTTGGYPKIATVISADLDFLAHVWPGESITFRLTDVEEAHRLRRARNDLLLETVQFAQGI